MIWKSTRYSSTTRSPTTCVCATIVELALPPRKPKPSSSSLYARPLRRRPCARSVPTFRPNHHEIRCLGRRQDKATLRILSTIPNSIKSNAVPDIQVWLFVCPLVVALLLIQLFGSLGVKHKRIDGIQFFSCGAVFAQNIKAPMVHFIHGHSVALLVPADKAVVTLTRLRGAKCVSMSDGIYASTYDAVFDCRIIPGVMRHVPCSRGWSLLRNSGRKCLVVA